jgi:hypothetical protein
MARNAIAYLEGEKQKSLPEKEIYDAVEKMYRRKLALISSPNEETKEESIAQARRYLDIARAARNVERHTAGELLESNRINDTVYQELIMDIDLQDARFSGSRSS